MATSGDRFISTLNADSLDKAKKELKEDPDNRDDAIQKLRDSIMNKEGS